MARTLAAMYGRQLALQQTLLPHLARTTDRAQMATYVSVWSHEPLLEPDYIERTLRVLDCVGDAGP